MQKKDRGIQPERRKNERFTIGVDIEWAVDGELNPGRLTDISVSGCFILSGGQFSDGEVVSIYFPLTDGTRTAFRGEIRNHVPEIGFALRFLELTDLQKEFIRNFAELHQTELVNN